MNHEPFHSKVRPSMLTKFQVCVACVVCVSVTCRVRRVFVVYIVYVVTYLYLGNHTTHTVDTHRHLGILGHSPLDRTGSGLF